MLFFFAVMFSNTMLKLNSNQPIRLKLVILRNSFSMQYSFVSGNDMEASFPHMIKKKVIVAILSL